MSRKRKAKKKTNKKGILIGVAAIAVIGVAGNSGNKKSDTQSVARSTVQPETQLIVQTEAVSEIQSDITEIDYSDQGMFNAEPDTFSNFFEAIYWATVSLTTVGYGDIYATSTIGKIITMVSAVFGIAIVALPAGIITAGYMDEISKKDQ